MEAEMKAGDKVMLRGVVGDSLGDLVYVRPEGGGSAILISPKLLEPDAAAPNTSQAAASEVPPYARK